ncbi:MAG: LmbE family N-acetylglucosaminyl deacetylase [Flavobacteriaceae bacterium]|jgi:LmbE family N-acetylglucosaminyl deacetylase
MKNKIHLLLLIAATSVNAQSSAEIYKKIQRLNTLGSVLYVAAHPDDENTRLISLFSNQYNYNTAYLSMTRGDGGQNLIGTELQESLGLIRTQELLEARKIDGGQQFFTTANDFGYSKHPDETLQIWNKEEVLAEIVYRIRAFRPDIIIHRFDHRTPGSTHGHHSSSAILSELAFSLAANPKAFPEQLNNVSVWQPTRQFYNISWWAYGSKEKFDTADKSNMIFVESNPFDVLLGRSNAEVASKSRSQHKSQGFGSSPELGSQEEYLELINGSAPKNNAPFYGIDTRWSRLKGGKSVGPLIEEVLANFDFEKPYKSVPNLLKIYTKITALKHGHWRTIKLQEVTNLLQNCLGLRLQFNTSKPTGVANNFTDITLKALNPSPIPVSIAKIEGALTLDIQQSLTKNQSWQARNSLLLPAAQTTPYWLIEKGDMGNYKVSNSTFKGLAETPNPIQAIFEIHIDGSKFFINVPLTYRTTDRVAGEVVENFQLVPKITTQLNERVIIFKESTPKKVRLSVRAHTENSKGSVTLCTPKDWKINPLKQDFEIATAGASQEFVFEVTPPEGNATGLFTSLVTQGNQKFSMQLQEISYPHISKQYLVAPNETKAVKIALKSTVNNIAYLRGAGDKISENLRNIGIEVTEFDTKDLSLERLVKFPTLVVGIRAFNVHKDLTFKNKILWDYVAQGGTVVVQYNTSRGFDGAIAGPYTISFNRDRVTDENAIVTILNPQHPLLNTPNKITTTDFEGWVQERGLYFSNTWDANYEPLLSMHDKGETPKKGSLLVTNYGKGKFIFTGLSFFRELPAGVPGAYRLFANLISYGQ